MEGVKYEGEMGRYRAKGGGPVPAASLTSGMSSCTCACQRKNKHEENEALERQDEKTSGSCKNQLNITL